MGYIYKITNKVNKKIYIGKTTQTIQARWKQHVNRALNDLTRTEHFMNAIRKWGKDNFIIEEIEQCKDESLDERERFWIAYYDSYYGWGYNSTEGGDGTVLYDHDLIRELWEKGLSVSEISEHIRCHRKTTSSVLHASGITDEEIKTRGNKMSGEKNKRAVQQYNSKGNFIAEYSCAQEAATLNELDTSNLRAACRGRYYAYGYYWIYKDNPTDIKNLIEEYKNSRFNDRKRSVDQYKEDGTYCRTWKTMSQAADYYNCTVSNIYRSCHHYYEGACGYLWTYTDLEEDMDKRCEDYRNRTDPRGIPVKQYDLQGNFIRQYNSCAEAARILGVDRSAIHKGVTNHYTSYNYIWIMPGEENRIPEIIHRHETKHDTKKKIVYQYSLAGDYLNSYPSAADACLAMGLDRKKGANLSRNCQGYQQSFNGYKWSYEGP